MNFRRRLLQPAPADVRALLLERRDALARAHDAVDPLSWARQLRSMEQGGLPLSDAQKRAWRLALASLKEQEKNR